MIKLKHGSSRVNVVDELLSQAFNTDFFFSDRYNYGVEYQVWNFAVLADSGQNNSEAECSAEISTDSWSMLCMLYSWLYLCWFSPLCGCVSVPD